MSTLEGVDGRKSKVRYYTKHASFISVKSSQFDLDGVFLVLAAENAVEHFIDINC